MSVSPAGVLSGSLPETFTRSREQNNLISITVTVLRIVVILVGVAWGLFQLVRSIRRGSVRWKVAVPIAAVGALSMTAVTLVGLPLAYQSYSTAIPLATFEATQYIQVGLVLVFAFLIMGVIAGLLTSSFPDLSTPFVPPPAARPASMQSAPPSPRLVWCYVSAV